MKVKMLMSSILLMSGFASATSIVMESGYVKAGVSDDGTFGVGGTTTPGILYDENGTGNYGVDDYLTPGTPFEFFTLQITGDTNVTYTNNNSKSSPDMNTSISGDMHTVTAVSSTPDGLLELTQTYTLDDGSKIIQVDASVENISATTIKNAKFSRGLDPDVDVVTYGSYDTNNTRGYDGSAEGLPVFPATDVVIAEGISTKKVISLLYTGKLPHNTNVDRSWGVIPSVILEGKNDGFGDYTINVAMDLGKMEPGDIVEFRYGYVLGDNLADLGDILPPEGGKPPVVTPPVVTPPIEGTPDQPYDRNDNPAVPQHGSAPSFNFGSLFAMFLIFGLLSYRRMTAKEMSN